MLFAGEPPNSVFEILTASILPAPAIKLLFLTKRLFTPPKGRTSPELVKVELCTRFPEKELLTTFLKENARRLPSNSLFEIVSPVIALVGVVIKKSIAGDA